MILDILTPPQRARFSGGRGGPVQNAVDYEQGGVALHNTSKGLRYQVWRYQAIRDRIELKPVNGPAIVVYQGTELITEVSGTFDQNMRPCFAFVESGAAKLLWYDPIEREDTLTTLPEGVRTPRMVLNPKDPIGLIDSDIYLFYVREGSVYFRIQRERYDVEHLAYGGEFTGIVRVGMSSNYRFQIELRG